MEVPHKELSKDIVRLVFVGSPLLDICTKCDNELLKKFGLKDDECVKATEHHEALFHNLLSTSGSELSAGGSAQNTARIAKWTLEEKGEVSFIGCVGDDVYEEWLRNTLAKEGVIPLYICVPGKKTGVCACLLTEQDGRSMITRPDAATALSKEHFYLEHIKRKLAEADHIFIVGYLLSHSATAVITLANMCSDNQILSLSLSAAYICKDYNKELIQIMPRVDILLGNETEVVAFAETLSGEQPLTVLEALHHISLLCNPTTTRRRIIVVTRGIEPVIVDDGSGSLQYCDVPANATVVDSVGCGDALAGAFVAKLALTNSLDISIKAGISAATKISQMKGCNPPLD